jgi:DNA-binding CsgD family transcriptional regulator
MPAVVGRDAELEAIGTLLDRGARGLVLEGPPGIGKTTLWREGVRRASEHGIAVLTCRPASHETRLAFSGLGDLIAPVLPGVLTDLPDPQQRALEVSLLLRDAQGPPPEERAIGVALTTALRTLADRTPVLIAIDDVQWLDASSTAALAFAVRRLTEVEWVGLFLSRRLEGQEPLPIGLGEALPPEEIVRLTLPGLTVGALSRVLTGVLEVTLPRPTMLRVHEASAGNPFFAVELGRALAARGDLRPALGPLPIPATLDDLLRERIEALPDSTQPALLLLAAAGRPSLALLEQALAVDPNDALRPAFDARVVEGDGETVSFTHPLLAASVYSRASPSERRAAHSALAAVADGVEERARHLSSSVDEPDEEVAAALESAAEAAFGRGAPSSAAELAVRARDLTPPAHGAAATRRALLAGEMTWIAGDYDEARAMLETIVDASPPGGTRADALLRLARNARDMRESIDLCRTAWTEAEGNETLRSDIDSFQAVLLHAGGDVDEASLVAARAADAAAATGDRRREALPRALHALMELVAGRDIDLDVLRDAAAVETATKPYPARIGPRFFLAQALTHVDELDECRNLLVALETEAREDGDVRYGRIMLNRALVEIRAGRLELARQLAEEALDLWQDVGVAQEEGKARATLAQAQALLGLEEEARTNVAEGRRLSREASEWFGEIRAGYAEVLLELSLEHWPEAATSAETLVETCRRGGFRSPLHVPATPCAVEALVAVGELGPAESLLADIDRVARRQRHPRLAMYRERCRGLVHAARGDLAGGIAALEQARETSIGVRQPFERARTSLLLGRGLLRAKRRTDARTAIGEALAAFDTMGAALWAARAREELRRIGGRAASAGELTEGEQRVAELAATGKTNKEIAAALFVTTKTVEFHLRNVYRKLGVRSRVELAQRLLATSGKT